MAGRCGYRAVLKASRCSGAGTSCISPRMDRSRLVRFPHTCSRHSCKRRSRRKTVCSRFRTSRSCEDRSGRRCRRRYRVRSLPGIPSTFPRCTTGPADRRCRMIRSGCHRTGCYGTRRCSRSDRPGTVGRSRSSGRRRRPAPRDRRCRMRHSCCGPCPCRHTRCRYNTSVPPGTAGCTRRTHRWRKWSLAGTRSHSRRSCWSLSGGCCSHHCSSSRR